MSSSVRRGRSEYLDILVSRSRHTGPPRHRTRPSAG